MASKAIIEQASACVPDSTESDILLVVDRSGSMANDNKLADAKAAVTTFVNLTSAPPDKVGLVSFATNATLDQPLTTNKAVVISATQVLTANGNTRMDLGLLQARVELTSTRHVITHTKVIILLSDGQQTDPPGDASVLNAANAAKAEGAAIYAIGLGPDADAALLQQVATSPSYYYFAPTSADLEDIYQQISSSINCAGARVIAFTRPQPGIGADANIWIMDADGSNQTQLTTYVGDDQWPALSPDGTRIAYLSLRNNIWTFWMMNSDGSNAAQLPVNGHSNSIAWSADGTKLAYSNESQDWWEIWTMNPDGSNQQRLTTHNEAVGMPSWSPNGQQLVYAANRTYDIWDLYKVNSNGTGQSLFISADAGFNHHIPAWSPDGAQIATARGPAGSFNGPWDLWVMNVNGSNGSVLVQNIDHPHVNNLSWSADSNWLVFNKNGQIWRVQRDGSNPTQITINGGWQPSTSAAGFGAVSPITRVYLPALARNHCTGPVTDNFSNPASGWPIAETSFWSYGYLSGEYRLYAKASAFGAVSRGEKPTGQYTVEVDARVVSGATGSLGLVFGLTDDWSELYTFEVYPPTRQWVIFRFTGGQWYVVNYGTSFSIQSGSASNRLKVQTSTAGGFHADFFVNGAAMTTYYLPYDPAALRRVGLTATSDAAGFDARFDNYKLVYEGCPATAMFGAQQAIDAPGAMFETLRPGNLKER